MDKEVLKGIKEALLEKDKFLITSHVNPEGDSVGSQIALFQVLKNMGKKVMMVDQDEVPENVRFLDPSRDMLNQLPEDFKPENLIVLDCPVKERIGNVADSLAGDEFVINIDHHVSNEYFGDINWVEPRMSSVGEMVYNLMLDMGVEIDEGVATAIYAAIVTDTGMFNYDNTSQATHVVAGELIARGADPKEVYREIYESKSAHEVSLLGKVLSTLRLEADSKLAYMTLTRKMYEEVGVKNVATDDFINFPRSIKGVEIAVFFKESINLKGRVNVSFRSTGNKDVNKLASIFGGGGHSKASGCLLDCTIEEAVDKVTTEARKMLKEDK